MSVTLSFEVHGKDIAEVTERAAAVLLKAGYSGEMSLDLHAAVINNTTENVELWRASVTAP